MAIELRKYQEDLVEKIKDKIKNGNKSVCTVIGCGAGKSIIAAHIAKKTTDKCKRVLFLVHRKELLQQITHTFSYYGVNLDLCDFYMVQTATRRLNHILEPDMIIVDECHHIASKTYTNILNYFNKSIKIGFTATPIRMKEGGLGSVFETIVVGVTTEWLIKNKYLADYKYFSVELADASKLNIRGGDYKREQLGELMEKSKIYGDTLQNWEKIAKNKKTIIYCASVKSSKETVDIFKNKGYEAEHLDGTTPKQKRNEIMDKFRTGEIKILSNNELFGEGLDVPDCECVILLRPTKSLSLYIQQSMRSMRIDKKNLSKTAIIIDHVGNVYQHGFPCENREWSLEAKKYKKACEVPIKQCIKCFYVMPSLKRKCENCGHEIVSEQRYSIEKIDMELKQLKRIDVLKDKHHEFYKTLQTFSQLIEFQKEKKYKFAWCIRKARELKIEIPSKYRYMQKFIK